MCHGVCRIFPRTRYAPAKVIVRDACFAVRWEWRLDRLRLALQSGLYFAASFFGRVNLPARGGSGARMYVLRRVWDVPTRLFHWAIVVLICSSWVTQHEGWLDQHVLCGYAMTTLLLFRLIWGFAGSDTARFAHFLKGPFAAFRHIVRLCRGEPDHEVGHNAAGGWMVLAMLGLLCVQVGTGLCANDEVSVEGPLARVVGPANSDWLSHIHAVNFRLIEAVVALHLLAILTYRLVWGHRLVGPMVTGNKRLPDTLPVPRMTSPVKAIGALCAAVGLVAFVVLWFGS